MPSTIHNNQQSYNYSGRATEDYRCSLCGRICSFVAFLSNCGRAGQCSSTDASQTMWLHHWHKHQRNLAVLLCVVRIMYCTWVSRYSLGIKGWLVALLASIKSGVNHKPTVRVVLFAPHLARETSVRLLMEGSKSCATECAVAWRGVARKIILWWTIIITRVWRLLSFRPGYFIQDVTSVPVNWAARWPQVWHSLCRVGLIRSS